MFGAILGGLSVISSIAGARNSRKSRDRSKQAEELARVRSTIINIQNKRTALASIRRQQAVQRASAIGSGMAGGSADKATAGSVQSQGIAAVAQQQQQLELGAEINSMIGKANAYKGKSADWNAASGIFAGASSVASAAAPSPTATAPGLVAAP